MKEKNELWDSNPQLKLHKIDLKSSVCALKEILTSCYLRAVISKSQMKKLILRLAELQVN